MTDRTWIGGGNNQATNGRDWSSGDVPPAAAYPNLQFTDGLLMKKGTMNISAFDLGNNLSVPGQTQFNNPLFIAAPNHSSVTINLSHGAQLFPYGESGTLDLTIAQTDHAEIYLQGGDAVVDLAANSEWIGSFTVVPNFVGDPHIRGGTLLAHPSTLTVTGGPGATFLNEARWSNGTYGAGVSGMTLATAHVVLNANIVGQGGINLAAGSLEIGRSISAGQTIEQSGGVLTVDHPAQFAAHVDFFGGEIDLKGLMNATSFAYANNLLTVYGAGGRTVLDRLAFTANSPFGVERTSQGVSIFAGNHAPMIGVILGH